MLEKILARQKLVLRVCLIIIALCVLIPVVLALLEAREEGIFASAVGGGVIALIVLFVLIAYWVRTRFVRDMMKGKNVLVHWRYRRDEWMTYTEREFTREKSDSTKKLIAVAIIEGLVMFGIIALVGFDAWFLIVIVLLSTSPIILFIAMTPHRNYRRNRSRIGEVYIATHAVALNGQFVKFNSLGGKFESATVRSEPEQLLEIRYSTPQRHGRRAYHTMNIPIPNGEMQTAERLVAYFQNDAAARAQFESGPHENRVTVASESADAPEEYSSGPIVEEKRNTLFYLLLFILPIAAALYFLWSKYGNEIINEIF